MGISATGSGVGMFTFPLVASICLSYYGLFGTLLLHSAMALNMCVAGMLMFPLKLQKSNVDLNLIVTIGDGKSSGDIPEKSLININLKETGSIPLEFNGKLPMPEQSQRLPINPNRAVTDKVTLEKNKKTNFLKSNLSIWTEPKFILFAVSLALITMTMNTSHMLLSDSAKDNDIASADIAWLLPTIGICETVSRLGGGLVFNISRLRPHRSSLYLCLILVTGLSCLAWTFIKEYIFILVVCVFHGLSAGAMVSQRPVMTSDIIGVERLSTSLGYTIFLQGVCILAVPPFVGYLRDLTGMYMASFLFLGVAGLVSALLFVLIRFTKTKK